MTEANKEHQHKPKIEPLTKSGEAVVQCEGFRCLALQDKDGNWLDLNGKPIKVLKVISRLR